MPGALFGTEEQVLAHTCTSWSKAYSRLIEVTNIVFFWPGDEFQNLDPTKSKAKIFLKQKYGITSCYLLYIGGLPYCKNIKGLILAFRNIRRDTPEDYELVYEKLYNRIV